MRRKAKPIWWLMALGAIATIALGVCLYLWHTPARAETPSAVAITNAIDRLRGGYDNADPIAAIKALDTYGCEAVPYLVERLKVVHAGTGRKIARENDDPGGHVTWAIMALRYITGKDFRSRITRADLRRYSEEGRYWMTKDIAPGRTRFFGLWPSHGYYYFASVRAQADIIRQWRAYSVSGKCQRDATKASDFETYGFGDMPAAE